MSKRTRLPDRGVVSVIGPDARKLLGGLVTNDIVLLDQAPALYAALLTPQGKILFDFIVAAVHGGYLLETERTRAPDLAKRLSLYKLRADVEIRDASDLFSVSAAWGGGTSPSNTPPGGVSYVDPRLASLGVRIIAPRSATPDAEAEETGSTGFAAYHAHRIALGVPEGGRDFVFGDTFPHEALLDQLHGVSFTKGCFVGQEVVARMQHKATIRKRVVTVEADGDLPESPEPIMIGTVEIGRLGSVSGPRGLALVRIDRVAEAERDGRPITVADRPLRVAPPAYATFEIKVPHDVA